MCDRLLAQDDDKTDCRVGSQEIVVSRSSILANLAAHCAACKLNRSKVDKLNRQQKKMPGISSRCAHEPFALVTVGPVSNVTRSGQNLANDVSVDIRQPEIPARVAIGKFFVVNAEDM